MASGQAIDRNAAGDWCERLSAPYRRPFAGAVAAFGTADDTVFQSYGWIDARHPSPPGAGTLFEIGSITKVFTALLLAKFASQGRIDLDAPIASIAPEFAGAPEWITPRRLSTHSSGLPRIPWSLWSRRAWSFSFPESKFNTYPCFGETELIEWMARYRPSRRPRTNRSSYSNLGVGLLGFILGRIAGSTYEAALKQEILDPLDLKDTRIALDENQLSRFATPHRGNGKEAPPWNFEALAGAGALRSTAHDLVKFGRAIIAATEGAGPLHEPIVKTLEIQIAGRRRYEPSVCLGWHTLPAMDAPKAIYGHDGGTFGSMSLLFVCPEAGFVILSLANTCFTLRIILRQIKCNPAGLLKEIVETLGQQAASEADVPKRA